MMRKTYQKNFVFYLIFGILAFSSLYLIRSYLGLLFLAIVITMVFDPVYQFLLRKIRQPVISSIFSTIFLIFVVLIPLILVFSLAIAQALIFFNSFSKNIPLEHPLIQSFMATTNHFAQNNFSSIDFTSLDKNTNIIKLLGGSLSSIWGILIKNIFPLITVSIQAITQTVFFFVFVVYLFPSREKIFKSLENITPIKLSEHQQFISRFEAITVSTMKSMVLIGVVQGFLGGIMLSILGFPAAAFWGLIMAIVSMIPLGSGIIWIPICIFMALSGQWIQALILFAWGAFVISSVDNIIRAKLLSQGKAKLPEILTLLSILGGLNTFGFWGFIYGPALVGLFYTALTIYSEKKSGTNSQQSKSLNK